MRIEEQIRAHLMKLLTEFNSLLLTAREEDVDRCRALQSQMNALKWVLHDS